MPTTLNQSSNDIASMIARVIGVPCNSQVADFVPSVTKKLQALVPELYPEDLNTQVQGLSDSSQKPPIFQLFELAAYFSSNNMLSNAQARTFVDWVITQNHVAYLMFFLRQRWDMLTVQAFVHRLVEAGASVKNKDFLQQLHAIGAKFDEASERIMEMNDPDFLAFVLRTLDPESLEGEPGGRLLRLVSRTPHIAVAELIIEAGAEINVRLSKKRPTTPLWEAIYHGDLGMVKCLIQAGADINRKSAMAITGFHPPASEALSLAVWKGDERVVKYLIDQDVAIKGSVHELPLLEYAAGKVPQIYDLLLEKSGGEAKVTVERVLIAAGFDASFLSEFLSQHPEVSKRLLEETLVMALRKMNSTAVVNLLQLKVDPNGSHLPETASFCPLRTVVTEIHDLAVGCQYIDLLIHAKVDVNAKGILELLAKEDFFSSSYINKLVDAGLDLIRHGPSALEQAIMDHESDFVWLFLVSKGISVNSYGRRATPFQAAAYGLSLDHLQYLFERGAEVNKPPFRIQGYTALQGAASSWSIEKLEFLLNKGADINAFPAVTGGVTALEATVRPWAPLFEYDERYYMDEEYSERGSGLTETFIYLLSKGAVVNRPNWSSSPLLHDIIERRSIHLLNLTLRAGANAAYMWATFSSAWCERTPLQLAAEMGQQEAVKLLLSHKADPNAPPAIEHGRTALQAAASSEIACIETVKMLLDNGAAVNADPAPIGGITALQGAAIKGYFQIALLLLQNEANVNAPAAITDGRTAIEGAAEHGRLDMVKMLLNAGAVGDRNTGFTRAISLARKNRHFAVIKLLES
ncbi:ankyrin [Fusarium beomiforme]|uniref:Ankyrin n=1 Tax=Fusarium beomiforme TaxID=44412 RepID=A0A9P5AV11_9HYPO|nr:ankyrin [Fusarium beomiforme]